MADTKISGLTADTTPTSDDLVVTVNAPGSSPANRKVTLANLPVAWGTTATALGYLDPTSSIQTQLNAKQASDATLTALAGLTIADVSIIEGTGADAFNVVTSGGANRILGSNSDNTALEFKSSLSVSEINLPSSDADPATTSGQIKHDTSHESITGGVLKWFDGTNVRVLMDRLNAGTGSGNLKSKGYIVLTHPHLVDGTGCVLQTTPTTEYYGQGLFADDADKAVNYLEYRLTVPEDIDLNIDLKLERWKFRLGGADTGKHAYIISMDGVADSAPYAGSLGDPVNVFFAGDASGADGDVETVSAVTLTDWKAALTAGQLWVIRMARDGDDATNDTSTVDSYSGPLVISYGKVQ